MGASLSLHGDEGRALATSAFIFDLGPERVLDVADAVRPHHDNNGLPRRLGPARHVASILDRGSRRRAHHYALGLSDLGGPLDALGRGDVAPLVHNATRRVAQLGRRLAWGKVFATHVMCNFTPRVPKEFPTARWVTLGHLVRELQPHAPNEVWHLGPNNLRQLITDWYKDHPAFDGLPFSAWGKRLKDNDPQAHPRSLIFKFCFEYTPSA